MHLRFLFLFLSSLFLFGCSSSSAPALSFYLWKTRAAANPDEVRLWRDLQPRRAYIRLFDIDMEAAAGRPRPVAHFQRAEHALKPEAWIPVVFITNRTMAAMDYAAADKLAERLLREVFFVVEQQAMPAPQGLQIDCDWTASTRAAYFHLLKRLKAKLDTHPGQFAGTPELSATIRLHQVRDQATMGVPPVDRGALMVYQTSSALDLEGPRSILDLGLVSGYLRPGARYPIPLDVALPIFYWTLHYNADGRFLGILRQTGLNLAQHPHLKSVPESAFRYVASADFLIGETRIKRADYLKSERIQLEELQQLSDLLAERLAQPPRELIFFHFDTQLIDEVTYGDAQALQRLRQRY